MLHKIIYLYFINYINSIICYTIYYLCVIRNEVITIKRYTIMAASVIKQRTIEKFIMSEFVQGNLNTKEAEYVSRASK